MTISPADVFSDVPTAPPPGVIASGASRLAVDAVFSAVRQLMRACGASSNKDDRLAVAISALIEHGIDTEPRIVGAAARLDFMPKHARGLLRRFAKAGTGEQRWSADDRGKFSNV